MRQVSSLMYLVGKIFNIITIVLMAALLVIGILIRVNAQAVYDARPVDATFELGDVKLVGTVFIIAGSILFVVSIVIFILAAVASKKLKNQTKDFVPHSIMIIIGAFGTNIFYLLGGIFGVLAENEIKENE